MQKIEFKRPYRKIFFLFSLLFRSLKTSNDILDIIFKILKQLSVSPSFILSSTSKNGQLNAMNKFECPKESVPSTIGRCKKRRTKTLDQLSESLPEFFRVVGSVRSRKRRVHHFSNYMLDQWTALK